MLVSQLAKELNVSADTVRFYTREGFLKPNKNPTNGYKNYSNADKRCLHFIISARHLGFSVEDIRQILAVSVKGKTPCPLVRELIQKRLAEAQKRFDEVLALRDHMKRAMESWQSKPDKLPTGSMVCHLIESWPGS